jgi:hypothetical protein
MLAALLTSLFTWQEPTPPARPAEPAPAPAQSPAPAAPAKAVEAWDDKTAKAAVDEWNKLMKGTPSMAEKSKALDRLAAGSNKLLVKPLAQVVETDKSLVVRKRAAELLAQQPAVDANQALRRLLKSDRLKAAPAVLAEIVRGVARSGYQRGQWGDFKDLFEREYHLERVPVQEAVLELVIQHKEKDALPMLLQHIDEPTPANVDDASNPPQEYWEARWKSWSIWRGKVKEAIYAITGQRFSTAAEAKEWLRKNPIK